MVCRYYFPFYRLSFHLLNRSFQSSVVPLVYFLSCSQYSGILHFKVEEKKTKKKKKSTKSQVDPLERSSKLDWQKSKKQSRELKPVWMKMVTALPTLCKHKENWACQQSGYTVKTVSLRPVWSELHNKSQDSLSYIMRLGLKKQQHANR